MGPDLSWDHNAHYWPLLLRELPPHCDRVLEVGCGAGALAAVLAGRATRVDAVDRSPAMVAPARARVPGNVQVTEADRPRPEARAEPARREEDGVLLLPLEEALRVLAAAVRPGGVLAAVVLPRSDLPRELPVEAAAGVLHRVVGLVRWVRGRRDVPTPGMPVREPELTVREVRRRAAGVLPGVRVRRLLFWRYLLVWRRPG
ncbi:MAG TPA: methyltransferase domain-containing protein [Geodermatophilus sp.]|nr:methyltransferase domain-containing protein [Geodermatophilus sp.]